jgi:hypothetical protein
MLMQKFFTLVSITLAQLNGISNIRPFPPSVFCNEQSGNPGEGTGQQQPNGGIICVNTVQGMIPDVDKMISSIITAPASEAQVNGFQGFQVQFTSINMMAGNTVNMQNQFLLVPQTLDPNNGLIQGFMQISIQNIPNPQSAPEASQFSFFSALDTTSDANGIGRFTVTVPPNAIRTRGLHRICTVAASASGQPVIMAVAQRGAQDDCIRVTIV